MSKFRVRVPEYEAIWYVLEVEADNKESATSIATAEFAAAYNAAADGDADEDGETPWSRLADYKYDYETMGVGVKYDEIRATQLPDEDQPDVNKT